MASGLLLVLRDQYIVFSNVVIAICATLVEDSAEDLAGAGSSTDHLRGLLRRLKQLCIKEHS